MILTPTQRMVCPTYGCMRPLAATQQVFWNLDTRTGTISTAGGDRNIFTGSFRFEIACAAGHSYPPFTGTTTKLQKHLQGIAEVISL